MSDSPDKQTLRAPLDDRLAERPARDDDPPEHLVRTRTAARFDRPDEVTALAVGALMLQKVEGFGQTRVFGRAIEAVIERATADLPPREVMSLEVEAYAILDWLVGGEALDSETHAEAATRSGDVVRYDPNASTVELVQQAILETFDLKIDYFSRQRGEMNTRRISPVALEAETYLRAYCHARGAERVFRLNRITRCVPINGRPKEITRRLEAISDAEAAEPFQISLLED